MGETADYLNFCQQMGEFNGEFFTHADYDEEYLDLDICGGPMFRVPYSPLYKCECCGAVRKRDGDHTTRYTANDRRYYRDWPKCIDWNYISYYYIENAIR